MSWFQEERAEAFRLALGISGFPEREHMALLADFLGELLIIRRDCRIRQAKVFGHQGRALVLLPRGLSERCVEECVFHEAAHYLLAHGMSAVLREHGDIDDPRRHRLAEAWEEREEREVEDFLLAWLLPSQLVQLLRNDADLAEESGCAPALVRRRREQLRGKIHRLTAPPKWSAYPHFLLTRRNSAQRPAIRVRSRQNRAVVYEVFAAGDLDALQWRVNAELIALTHDEFCEKYRDCRVGDESETEAVIPLPELGRWAQRYGQPRCPATTQISHVG